MLATCPELVWLPWLSWTNALLPPRAYLIVLAARWLLHTGLPSSLATSGSLNWLKKIHASYLDHLVLNFAYKPWRIPGLDVTRYLLTFLGLFSSLAGILCSCFDAVVKCFRYCCLIFCLPFCCATSFKYLLSAFCFCLLMSASSCFGFCLTFLCLYLACWFCLTQYELGNMFATEEK